MAELTRVPAPGSPLDGWTGRALGLVAVVIAIAVVKPWGSAPAPPVAAPVVSATARPPVAPETTRPVPTWDPRALGAQPPPPAWAVVTAHDRTPLAFMQPSPSADDPDLETAADVASGPVVDLGPADTLHAIAIAHPVDQSVASMRLWRFGDGRPPRRIDLREMPSPWPAASVLVVVPAATAEAGSGPWDAGLYRLDLLIEPGDRIRSLMLLVGGRTTAAPGRPSDDALSPDDGFELPMLRRLPPTATLWSAGRILSGWRRDPAPRDCRIARIWQATDPQDPCWPVPIGRSDAIGVNLDDGRAVTGISLQAIDPLPDGATPRGQMGVGGRPGIALVRAPSGGFPDGVYRLDVVVRGELPMTWYLEVGPLGRAVDPFNEASTTR